MINILILLLTLLFLFTIRRDILENLNRFIENLYLKTKPENYIIINSIFLILIIIGLVVIRSLQTEDLLIISCFIVVYELSWFISRFLSALIILLHKNNFHIVLIKDIKHVILITYNLINNLFCLTIRLIIDLFKCLCVYIMLIKISVGLIINKIKDWIKII